MTPWTVAHQASLSMEFSRQEYQSRGCHFLLQGFFPIQGSNSYFLYHLHWQADSLPWSREWLPTPGFLPRESHGQRNLVDYSPLGCKELDMTEQLNILLHHTKINICFCTPESWSDQSWHLNGARADIIGIHRGTQHPLQHLSLHSTTLH